jgi:hypothetical protein
MATYKVRIKGTSPYLQHRYPKPKEEQKFKEECESKGLDPKKTSNIEASWYRNKEGAFIPAEHLKQALVGAGKGEKVGGKGNATWNNTNYESEPVEVAKPVGTYPGPWNHVAFHDLSEEYYRKLVGVKGSGIRIEGGKNIRMRNNKFILPWSGEFDASESSGWSW